MRLAAINALHRDAFVALLGGVFEHSPWVAAASWEARPFASHWPMATLANKQP